MAQVRRAAGVASEAVDARETPSLNGLIQRLAERRGEPLRTMLLDGGDRLQPSVLVFVNDRHVLAGDKSPLRDGDTVTLLSPVSGG